MCYGEQRVSDDLEKANLFNEYFFSVFLKDLNLKFTCPPNSNTQSLHDIEISTTEVFEILSTLDVNKAPGIDGISPAVLKYCASPLLVPLCHLFTCSISSGRIPIQWCTHCIIPIYKSGDKTHKKLSTYFTSVYCIKSFGKNRLQSHNELCNEFFYTASIRLLAREINPTTINPFY